MLCLSTQSCLTLYNHMDCSLPGSSVYGDSPSKNTRVGCHALLHGIFPTQGSIPGLPHCGWILYRLSHQGSPRILEWVAYPFSRGSSRSRNHTWHLSLLPTPRSLYILLKGDALSAQPTPTHPSIPSFNVNSSRSFSGPPAPSKVPSYFLLLQGGGIY